MPLNLIVVDTAAVSVKLRLDPVTALGAPAVLNSPEHLKDKVYIDRVDFTAYSNLGTVARHVYHRLAVTLPAAVTNEFVRATTGVLPEEETTTSPIGPSDYRRYIPLTPDVAYAGHTGKYIGSGATLSFTSPRVIFDTGVASVIGTNTLLGTITRKSVDVTKSFSFELQYQHDPMSGPSSSAIGVSQAAQWSAPPNGNQSPDPSLWYEYQQETDTNIVVTASDNLTYKVRVYHVDPSDYDPTGQPIERMWYAGDNTIALSGDINPLTTIDINGIVYTPQPATIAQTWLVDLLWSNSLFEGAIRNNVDYVLEVADVNATTTVDDLVSVTSTAKPKVSIGDHILYRQGGVLVSTGTGALKLFKGRSTRIYTNLLNWERVSLTSFDLDDADDDVTVNLVSTNEVVFPQPRGWTSFDLGQTVIGVNITAGGTVYLQVYLGPNSTGVNFDHLYINHEDASANLIGTFPTP